MLNGDDTRIDGELVAETSVRVPNRLGLHARPAAEFVKLSARFESNVSVEKDDLEVNGKSIMGVMMLAAEYGSLLRIKAVGPDAELTFHSQSTYVLPVRVRPGAFVFMADRWRPEDAIDGRYIWLPILFRNDRIEIEWTDEWDLGVFGSTETSR